MERPSIRQLESLVAVADHLNFRKAAEACYITQPALSAQIQQLEALLGVPLFERDRRRVVPTPAGRDLAEKARKILVLVKEFGDSASPFKEPLTGDLKLGVIPTVAPYLLPGALAGVRTRFPQLRLHLHEAPTEVLVRQLEHGDLDLLLLAMEAELGDAETHPLFSDPFQLAVPATHPLAKRKTVTESDLTGEDVLLLDDMHCLRDQALDICHRTGMREKVDCRASSLSTLVQMVAGGLGVTLLPELALAVEVSPDRPLGLLRFRKIHPQRTIGLAWRPTSFRKDEFRLLGAAITASQSD
ncbi:MAG TPA: LysR family transcriptional regulator [Planctomycetes bacterium]|nr:LysR family transcriptional regulator [Planctomycetota bacterium]